jgi:hypothetical protein
MTEALILRGIIVYSWVTELILVCVTGILEQGDASSISGSAFCLLKTLGAFIEFVHCCV